MAMGLVLDERVVEAVGWGLVHSVWELAVVAVVVWGILRAVPRGFAGARYGVAICGMGVMVVCVAGMVWGYLPSQTRAGGEVRPVVGGAVEVERLLLLDHPQTLAEQQVVGSVGTVSVERRGIETRVLWWVVWGYLAGVAVCCLRLVGMWAGMVRMGRGATAARESVQGWGRELAGRMRMGMVRVVESARVEVPMVVGVLRPVVVVPVMAVTGLSEQELRALLAHEMAHVRRWDPVVNAVQCVVEAVLFYHPAVWWMSRVIREERECCCDDVAVEVVGDRAGYAGALAAMEGLRAGAGGRLAIGAGSGKLAGRVERLLGRRRELHGGRGWALATCVMAAVAVGMGAWVAGCARSGGARMAERAVGDGEVVERVYDVSDMLVPTGKAELVMPPAGREDGVWKGNFFAAASDQTMAEIKETVETVVSPDTWKGKGGKVGEIVLMPNGLIAVTQTGAGQRGVKGLLEQLRETRAVRIGVKCELLVMSKEAYDGFGGDKATMQFQGQEKWSGTILDGYQWGQVLKVAGEKAVVAGKAETEALNGQATGVRLGGEAVPGGVRMAMQATASADRRYVVLTLRTAAGPGESNPPVRTLVSVPEKGATLCLFLGKAAVAGGQEKYLVWAMRTGVLAGAAKTERGWGFGEEAATGEVLAPFQNLQVLDEEKFLPKGVRTVSDAQQAAYVGVREQLKAKVNLKVEGTFAEAVAEVQRVARVNVVVNWRAVEAAGVKRTTPVVVTLRDVPVEKALKELLNAAGGEKVRLGYLIDDGVVAVSTREDLESEKYQVIRVFDIRDMLVVPVAMPLALPKAGEAGKEPSKEERAKVVATITKEIVDTIQTIVAPDSWREKGGKLGSIRELNGQLIVDQTEENAEAVRKLLDQLREVHAVQISLEGRACLLTQGAYGKLLREYPLLSGIRPQQPVLDDKALKEVLEEIQADAANVTVTGQRITAFNGQAVQVRMGELGKGSGGVGPVGWGFTEAMQSTATADRKGAAVHMKLGVPVDVRDGAKGQREVDVLVVVPDRQAVMVDAGETVGENGEARRVVWLVRPTVIVQREVDGADGTTRPGGQ